MSTFILYSGFPSWHISLSYEDDSQWIDVWPTEGDFDGRFSITVAANPTGYVRSSVLSVYAGKQIVYQLPIRQTGRGFSLALNVPDNRKTVAAAAQELEIVVTATVRGTPKSRRAAIGSRRGKLADTPASPDFGERHRVTARGYRAFRNSRDGCGAHLYITQTAN